MGISLFGVDIAGQIDRAMSSGLPRISLIQVTPGGRDPNDPTAQLPSTDTTHAARGFVDQYDDSLIDGTTIRRTDRILTIIGDSIEGGIVPQEGFEIIAEGLSLIHISEPTRPY